jgi:four helix bundle protein
MPSPIIAERAFDFAVKIIKLCERLWDSSRAAWRLADQLFDAGTSIGANAEEAQGGQTKADFLARLAIARKEAHETVYWLRLAVKSGLVRERDVAWELDEAIQLRRMITRAIHTGQSTDWRGGH